MPICFDLLNIFALGTVYCDDCTSCYKNLESNVAPQWIHLCFYLVMAFRLGLAKFESSPAAIKRSTLKMQVHAYSNGSVALLVHLTELVGIPVWRGNRHLDSARAQSMKDKIGLKLELLETTVFRTIKYCEPNGMRQQRFLVDGQHRQYVFKKVLDETRSLPDIRVLVIEQEVGDESEAIEYFNVHNDIKPQHDDDIKLLTNKYIQALELRFNKSRKCQLIKPEGKGTRRPFLSSESLRNGLELFAEHLKQAPSCVNEFVERVHAWNLKKCSEYEILAITHPIKDQNILDSCLDKKFVLAFDPKLSWIAECL